MNLRVDYPQPTTLMVGVDKCLVGQSHTINAIIKFMVESQNFSTFKTMVINLFQCQAPMALTPTINAGTLPGFVRLSALSYASAVKGVTGPR